ncbi:hypothetical protein Plhal703r1_c15g0073671 [Plasmopara halstedii]
METTNNAIFLDVNSDCDSTYIDPQVYLFQQLSSGSLSFIASNDDAGDDDPAYFSRGHTDGLVSARAAAISGRSTDSANAFSPHFCMERNASYGNYKMTVRVYCNVSPTVSTECVYALPAYIGGDILKTCS